MFKILKIFLVVINIIIWESTVQSAPALTYKRYSSTIAVLVHEILTKHFPQCDLILLQDAYFASNMNTWFTNANFQYPYYSLTLDGKPFPDYTTWQSITKTTGFLCSTIVAACLTFKTCRIPDSKTLYTMLVANGILLKERRALLFIENMDADNTTAPWISYQEQIPKPYTITSLNQAKRIFTELNSHITIIRKLPIQEYQNSVCNVVKDVVFETLTFTPTWFPGGTPVFKNIWSLKRKFLRQPILNLNISQVRKGGDVTFCVSSKHIPPAIDVSFNNTITGLDGEMIKILLRRFGLTVKFIEPFDKEFGSKRDGEWTGVIGSIIKKEADFGLGQITFTLERFETGLKFTPAIIILTAVAICPLPKFLPRYKILSYPFDNSTWVCVLVTSGVCIIVIEILQRISCKLFGLKFTFKHKTIFIKLRNQQKLSWIQSLGPLFLRSIPLRGLPHRWAILGMFSCWLFFTFVVNVNYTNVLIGALAVFPREEPIRSPYALLHGNKDWTVAPIVEQTISNSSLPAERLLVQRAVTISDNTNEPPDAKVFRYINSTENCAVAESTRSQYYLSVNFTIRVNNHDYTKVYVTRESIFIGPQGWAMREDMDFLMETYLNNLFLQYRCFGFIYKVTSSWLRDEHRVQGSQTQPLSMIALEPVFLIYVYGLGAGLFVLTLELLAYKYGQAVQRIFSFICPMGKA